MAKKKCRSCDGTGKCKNCNGTGDTEPWVGQLQDHVNASGVRFELAFRWRQRNLLASAPLVEELEKRVGRLRYIKKSVPLEED